jgi:hypothetical protein
MPVTSSLNGDRLGLEAASMRTARSIEDSLLPPVTICSSFGHASTTMEDAESAGPPAISPSSLGRIYRASRRIRWTRAACRPSSVVGLVFALDIEQIYGYDLAN